VSVRVLIADDHRLMREGTAALLAADGRIEVVSLARDGLEAIEEARKTRPDVAMLDLNMPGVGGIQACAVLRNRQPGIHVLILTVSERQDDVYQALRVGAAGYLLKDMPPADLIDAVLRAGHGEPVIAPSMASRMLVDLASEAPRRDEGTSLTDREREVLTLLATGAPNAEIGRRLGISEPTVKTHVRHVLEKLHLRNRAAAAAYAAREVV
jgi:DNA-binding NarL/FixJ family response regulator